MKLVLEEFWTMDMNSVMEREELSEALRVILTVIVIQVVTSVRLQMHVCQMHDLVPISIRVRA